MANNIDMAQAIKAINPSAEFRYEDDNYETIQWLNGTNPISISDIQAKQAELQTAYDAEEWKRNRQAEYPNHNDCIHALLDGGDTLTNLQAKRTAVKDKYPKE
tara:strand:+ start:655 stop:963 length:309 start_codon:yes stop_codon:yes gene_type:complete